MKKEISIIQISFQSILNYKSSVLLLIVQASVQIMISVSLWAYIYQSNQTRIAGYNFTSMVQYYLGTIIFSYFVFYPVDWEINDDIHSGNFFSILLKPITFYRYYFCKMLGDRIAHLLFSIIPVILFSSIYYRNEFLSIETFIFGSISIVLSMVLWFLLSCCVGMLSFWLENIFFVLTVKEIVIQFLSGIVLPLNFFSNNVRLFVDMLPFKYLVYEPLQIIRNETYQPMEALGVICVQLIWCILLYMLSRFLLRKGVEHFSNVGG
ncbi:MULTISPECIES: ABC-2 family transporter protein [unclassified Streptococcus]|uniref:ABC transporter permease n=1 Tax=unclassified Streptococcus TaxID=2608887 RepID=UPI0010729350|nr:MULTISPECIES: ABC-2 family transporter protein [unclassified Streptococcus]MBF0787811.1 ABC-2 family transporter protein [Streptococcus sp. 19428wC2_LYSM12]MCQ9212785.1 ABC-2 family transporter protein [Streptococcus sp. B01]MCQ9214126.1 ABC-2 family transporter protein [Streptococcus sp. O1]TFV05207.1 ABC transporter permease [Streptococcus sp. LYSM12]